MAFNVEKALLRINQSIKLLVGLYDYLQVVSVRCSINGRCNIEIALSFKDFAKNLKIMPRLFWESWRLFSSSVNFTLKVVSWL